MVKPGTQNIPHIRKFGRCQALNEAHEYQPCETVIPFLIWLAQKVKGRYRYMYLSLFFASSVRGQDESNPALWLATQAGTMELSCPLGTTCCFRQKIPQSHIINPLLTKIKMAWYWPHFLFCKFMDLYPVSGKKHAKKITWPISSHLDFTLGQ